MSFLRYSMSKNVVTLKPELWVTQDHRNYTIRSGIHDFLLTFHSNHRPISHRFRDKRRFPSKIARKSPIFPTPVYLMPPLKGFPLEFGIGVGSEETRMMGLPDGRKSFKIGLAVLIQYRRVTDSQPATQPRRRSRYALCISASRSKKRLLFRWKWRESWATPLFLGNRQRREFNRFVEFASSEAIFWVSDVVATRFLRQISTQLSRDSSGIDSFCRWSEILFVRHRESELSTFYRNFTLKDALSSRTAVCQHFVVNVNVLTRFSRSKVEFLSSKVNCRRVPWFDCFSDVDVEGKLDSGAVAGSGLSTRVVISQNIDFCRCKRSVSVFARHFR